jgi:hypothetical protein
MTVRERLSNDMKPFLIAGLSSFFFLLASLSSISALPRYGNPPDSLGFIIGPSSQVPVL